MINLKSAAPKLFLWIVLLHVVLFEAFWLTNASFYSYTNDYLAHLLGVQIDYVSLCLLMSGAIGLWTTARLAFFRSRRRNRLSPITALLYALVALVFILFFYGSFWLLLRESPAQFPRIGQLLVYFRVILDPILLVIATLVAARWSRGRLGVEKTTGVKAYAPVVLPALVPLLLIWAVMLVFSPGSVYRGVVPAKPLVIAHRGASMIAPENTLAALEKAGSLGTFGVEFDLCLSRDGIPFLMHDDELKRTTNVAQVFPGRENDRAESFTLAEVQRLNAGEWFVESDPYKSIAHGAVSAADLELYARQSIPSLAQVLDVLRKDKLTFIFDLKAPPANHPYGNSFFDIVFRQIHQAGIDSQVWFLANREQVAVLQAEAPDIKPTYGADFLQPPEARDLAARGYRIVNAEYGLSEDWIRRYHESGLWANIYTVDEAWQFSRLWLLGVDSITSSNVQEMMTLDAPLLGLPYSGYLVLWTGVGLLALVIFGFIVGQRPV